MMRLICVRIIAHLADVSATVLVVGHRDRTRDEWFAGKEVHTKTIEHLKSVCGVASQCRRDTGQFIGDSILRRHHPRILLGGQAELWRRRRQDKKKRNDHAQNSGHLQIFYIGTPAIANSVVALPPRPARVRGLTEMYLIWPLFAALAFALGSMIYKRAYAEGAGLAHTAILNNVV